MRRVFGGCDCGGNDLRNFGSRRGVRRPLRQGVRTRTRGFFSHSHLNSGSGSPIFVEWCETSTALHRYWESFQCVYEYALAVRRAEALADWAWNKYNVTFTLFLLLLLTVTLNVPSALMWLKNIRCGASWAELGSGAERFSLTQINSRHACSQVKTSSAHRMLDSGPTNFVVIDGMKMVTLLQTRVGVGCRPVAWARVVRRHLRNPTRFHRLSAAHDVSS